MHIKSYLESWAVRYKDDLTENILPFWLNNGLDTINGGIYTCIDREGHIYDTTKSVWFQGRFAFTCAYAYNNVEKRQEYLDAAKQTIDFIETHCFAPNGRMYFEVTAEGRPLRQRRYVFSESFAAIAMSEYAIATGNRTYAEKALAVFRKMQYLITNPGSLPPKYEPNTEMIGHSLTMILINVGARIRDAFERLGIDSGDWLYTLNAQIDDSIIALRDKFLHSEFKCLLETVRADGTFIDTQIGRTINPGHCIETAWFLLEEAKYREHKAACGKTVQANVSHDMQTGVQHKIHTDASHETNTRNSLTVDEIKSLAIKIFDWSWDWGWDEPYGGIINFRDCRNHPCQDYSQDMKFWWPQCEAIICCLYAYQATGDVRFLKRHKKISDWTYGHFPDHEYGEWYGYLHRDGTISQSAKGNIFKGPFHIPRMMTRCYTLCNELISNIPKTNL